MSILRGEDTASPARAVEGGTSRETAAPRSAEPEPPARSSEAGDPQPTRRAHVNTRESQADDAPLRDAADAAARPSAPEQGTVNEDGIRTFASNESAEQYAQRHLDHMYPELPPEQQRAVYEYTRYSWPYHTIVRGDPAATAATLHAWYGHPAVREALTKSFDGRFPTEADIRSRIDLIEQALTTHLLHEGLQTHRGLQDIDLMHDADGHRLTTWMATTGRHLSRDQLVTELQRRLLGSIQDSEGFVSTAVGTPPPEFAGNRHPFRLILNVPQGSPALWMGHHSHYPNQREMILPDGTQYVIVEVRLGPDGRIEIVADVLDS